MIAAVGWGDRPCDDSSPAEPGSHAPRCHPRATGRSGRRQQTGADTRAAASATALRCAADRRSHRRCAATDRSAAARPDGCGGQGARATPIRHQSDRWLDHLGVDKEGLIYWDGRLIKMARKITLDTQERILAWIVAGATVVAAVATVVQAIAAVVALP
jgi:hypothetical protein